MERFSSTFSIQKGVAELTEKLQVWYPIIWYRKNITVFYRHGDR